MPKERTRERQGRKAKRRGPNGRERDGIAHAREKSGDTRIDTLRQSYGDGFAPGIRGDAHLKTLLDRTGSSSLSDYLKTGGRSPVSGEDRVNEKAPNIRYTSKQRFEEAHRKTSTLHAGLFRRLAE